MAGSYCRYCNRRCFVLRRLPADARGQFAGMDVHLATCQAGREHDLRTTGYDATTALNPRRARSRAEVETEDAWRRTR